MVSKEPATSTLDFEKFFQSKKRKAGFATPFKTSTVSITPKGGFAESFRKIADSVPKSGDETINDQIKEVNDNLRAVAQSLNKIYSSLIEEQKKKQKLVNAKKRKDTIEESKERSSKAEKLLEGGGKLARALKAPFSAVNKALGNPFEKIKNALLLLGIGWLTDKFIKAFKADRDGDLDLFEQLKSEITKGLAVLGGIFALGSLGVGALIAGISKVGGFLAKWLIGKPLQFLIWKPLKFIGRKILERIGVLKKPPTNAAPKPTAPQARPAGSSNVKPRNLKPTGGGPRGTSNFNLEQARKALTKQRMTASTTAKSGGLRGLKNLFRPKAAGGPRVVAAGNPILTAVATTLASVGLGMGIDMIGNELNKLMGTDEGTQLAKLAEAYTNADPEGRKEIEAKVDEIFNERLGWLSNPLSGFEDAADFLTGQADNPTENVERSARRKNLLLQLKQYELLSKPNVTDKELLLFAEKADSQTKAGSGEVVVYPGGIGTHVRGRDPITRKFLEKYFDPNGNKITEKEFNSRVRALRKALMDSPTGNLADAPTAPAAPDLSVMMSETDFYNARVESDINERRNDSLLGASNYEEYKEKFRAAEPTRTVTASERTSGVEPRETSVQPSEVSSQATTTRARQLQSAALEGEGQKVSVDISTVNIPPPAPAAPTPGGGGSGIPALKSFDGTNPYRLLSRSIYNVLS